MLEKELLLPGEGGGGAGATWRFLLAMAHCCCCCCYSQYTDVQLDFGTDFLISLLFLFSLLQAILHS